MRSQRVFTIILYAKNTFYNRINSLFYRSAILNLIYTLSIPKLLILTNSTNSRVALLFTKTKEKSFKYAKKTVKRQSFNFYILFPVYLASTQLALASFCDYNKKSAQINILYFYCYQSIN